MPSSTFILLGSIFESWSKVIPTHIVRKANTSVTIVAADALKPW